MDETIQPGEEIVPGIRQEIRSATPAYVVLTDLNPNVMYEFGLLHEASKPTISPADKDTLGRLPFDIRTRMVVSFEKNVHAAPELQKAVIAATARLRALFDASEHERFITAPAAPIGPTPSTVQLSAMELA